MSILRAQRVGGRARPRMVVFVSIALPEIDRNAVFEKAVKKLGARADGEILVIPCDSLGVWANYREKAREVGGLPAHFLGISPPLRRHLESAYGCRPPRSRRDPGLDLAWRLIESTEEQLAATEHAYEALRRRNDDLPDADARLETMKGLVERLREQLREQFANYRRRLLGSGGDGG